jgi:hypothetical protein
MSGGPPTPAAPPMMNQEALKARARLWVIAARKALEMALPVLGSGSDEGKLVTRALSAIGGVTTEPAQGLSESEHQALRPPGIPGPVSQGGGVMGPGLGPGAPPTQGTIGGMPPTGTVMQG